MAAKENEPFELKTANPDNNETCESDILLQMQEDGPSRSNKLIEVPNTRLWSVQVPVAVLHATSVLTLVLLLPVYLQAINLQGDAYSAVLFVSLFSVIVLSSLGSLRLFWDKSFTWKATNWRPAAKNGIGLGIAALMMFYAMDRKRVPCHFQDSIYMLIFPFAVFLNMLAHPQGIEVKEGLSLALFMIGLFLGMDLQLANRFWCRGSEWTSPESDRGPWDYETNTVWVIIAAGGIGFFVYFLKSIAHTPGSRFANSIFSHLTAVMVILALCWTDCMRIVGKGSSVGDMLSLIDGGLSCHFSTVPDCGRVSALGWPFGVAWLVYIGTYLYMIEHSKSFVWPIAVGCSALPLTGVFWSFLVLEPTGSVVFQPQFSLALISSFAGVPLTLTGLYFLARHYQSNV